ncbi:hypothetical protein CA54_16830 [Symmachiella macrocystis]|uniref:Uncharacterized protein n=1 Tax=Symmachiella macrocystis TaxID=2527985 RepID=A0A5C6BMC4_9PLAN|nr:hypothetical protein [Symmachiella macrocystis]TWU12857.1 hypothetical protein CA54_16830 [Symmachiella macrocystis]
MSKFTDNAGREWVFTITVDDVRRVRKKLEVDLLDVDVFPQLASDPILLADVLFVLCLPQADADGITDEDFGRGLGGDAIDEATEAVLDALVNFSRSAKRATLRKVIDKQKALEARGLEAAETYLASGQAEKEMDAAIKKAGL